MALKLGIISSDDLNKLANEVTLSDVKFSSDKNENGKYDVHLPDLTAGDEVSTGDYKIAFFNATSGKLAGQLVDLEGFTVESNAEVSDVTVDSSNGGVNVTASESDK